LKMTLGQAEKTYKAYSSIMGKDPYWRKEMIKQSDLTFYDLDV
jgi:hypothetical protein